MDVRQLSIEPTGDNHAEVQRAVDALHEAGGGTVELASGQCPIGAPIELRSNVTLRGAGMIATVLRPIGFAGPLVHAGALLRGATLEELTIAGDADWDEATDQRLAPRSPSSPSDSVGAGVDLAAGASFCFLRRLRIRDLAGPAVRISGGPIDHLYLEHLAVEGCGGDGVVLDPQGEADAIFLTEISVRSFGLAGAAGSAGVRAAGRAFISQLHVQPIGPGHAGLALEPGSEHTVASNLFFGVAGGQARVLAPGAKEATIEAELTRELTDQHLARVYP